MAGAVDAWWGSWGWLGWGGRGWEKGQGRVSYLGDDFGDAILDVHLPEKATMPVSVLG